MFDEKKEPNDSIININQDCKIINADCEFAMASLPERSIDCVITSPPYDDLMKYKKEKQEWNFEKFKSVAEALFRVLKEG